MINNFNLCDHRGVMKMSAAAAARCRVVRAARYARFTLNASILLTFPRVFCSAKPDGKKFMDTSLLSCMYTSSYVQGRGFRYQVDFFIEFF